MQSLQLSPFSKSECATVVESRLRLSDVCGGLRSDDAKLRFLCSCCPLPALSGWPAELIMESCPGEPNYSFSSQLQGVPSLETWHMRELLHRPHMRELLHGTSHAGIASWDLTCGNCFIGFHGALLPPPPPPPALSQLSGDGLRN